MRSKPLQFKLGDRVKDIISGFSGICIAIEERLYDVDRAAIAPVDVTSEEGPPEPYWISVERLQKDKVDPAGFRPKVNGENLPDQ